MSEELSGLFDNLNYLNYFDDYCKVDIDTPKGFITDRNDFTQLLNQIDIIISLFLP